MGRTLHWRQTTHVFTHMQAHAVSCTHELRAPSNCRIVGRRIEIHVRTGCQVIAVWGAPQTPERALFLRAANNRPQVRGEDGHRRCNTVPCALQAVCTCIYVGSRPVIRRMAWQKLPVNWNIAYQPASSIRECIFVSLTSPPTPVVGHGLAAILAIGPRRAAGMCACSCHQCSWGKSCAGGAPHTHTPLTHTSPHPTPTPSPRRGLRAHRTRDCGCG